MTYKEIQEKAAELGISPVVGVSQKDLEEKIAKIEGKGAPASEGSTDSQEPPKEEAPKKSKSSKKSSKSKETPKNDEAKPEGDIAIVMNGHREARRYSLKQHGKSFIDNANEYASARGFQIKMTTEVDESRCSECGRPMSA